MSPKVIILFFSLLCMTSCGGHRPGIAISFPMNGTVGAIEVLDGKTAKLKLQRSGGGISELIIRDSGRGPLFRAIVPDTNVASPDLSTGFIIVDANARRVHVFYCEVSVVLDYEVGSDRRFDEITRVEMQRGSGESGVAYIGGARILNITGTYKINNPEIVPEWMTRNPLTFPASVDTLDQKWYEKYLVK